MKLDTKNVVSTPEILKRKIGGELLAPITVASGAFTSGVCKGGTVLTSGGAKATGADAYGILLYDVYEENPNGSLVRAYATVNVANAEANSGMTISSAMKSALSNITFE